MGKQGKKQRNQQQQRRGKSSHNYFAEDDDEELGYPVSSPNPQQVGEETDQDGDEIDAGNDHEEQSSNGSGHGDDFPSKFSLYQQSVQSPKGDISYLQKFFLTYVGGRAPLHLQEDFCGTALLSTEWLRSDSRRTAVGLDLDVDALNWCMENNVNKVGGNVYSRLSLFHGNVLRPLDATLMKCETQDLIRHVSLEDIDGNSEVVRPNSSIKGSPNAVSDEKFLKYSPLPARDIVCAFNYSCCCLHSRQELVSYFKYALGSLSRKGGIFVMDLYGGTSSECELRMQRKFPNFTYIWEQAGFDIVQRKTRISLHYTLRNQQKKLRHAFSYSWRLWSLPEIKDCLEEAGFQSVHFWLRQMPDSEDIKSMEGFGVGRDAKYEEVTSFQQQDSWNAYIVGVA